MGDILTSKDGFKWYVEKPDHRLPLASDEYTPLLIAKKLGGKDKIFVDVGAHVGRYAVRMAKHYKEVIAIEPNPESVRILLTNLKLNNIENVKVVQVAVGSRRERKPLYIRGGSSTLLSGVPSKIKIEVEIVPLHDIISDADVIKIDVEGYEVDVVKGALKLISRSKPILIIEHHEYRGYRNIGDTRKAISKLLPSYKHVSLGEPHFLWFPKDFDITQIPEAIVTHWFYKIIKNIENGRPWYFGLPYTWWHGCSIWDFIIQLPEHIKDEPLWVEML